MEFCLNTVLVKVFLTTSVDVITECRRWFGLLEVETLIAKCMQRCLAYMLSVTICKWYMMASVTCWFAGIYMSPWCWHFNFRTYICACHTSPSCVICFVTSPTKIQLNSIKSLHFTGTEWYNTAITSWHNYVTSRVWSHAHRGASADERVPGFVYI